MPFFLKIVYNLEMPKGIKGFQKGHKDFRTSESLKRIGEHTKKRWADPEERKKLTGMLGRKHSLKTRRKMSEAQKGNQNRGVGENHSGFKGNNVSYRGLHKWVESHLGIPKSCEECGILDKKCSDGRRYIHWANKSREYKRSLDDWMALCYKCHVRYDR